MMALAPCKSGPTSPASRPRRKTTPRPPVAPAIPTAPPAPAVDDVAALRLAVLEAAAAYRPSGSYAAILALPYPSCGESAEELARRWATIHSAVGDQRDGERRLSEALRRFGDATGQFPDVCLLDGPTLVRLADGRAEVIDIHPGATAGR